MSFFSIVAATSENTVVTEYEPAKRRSEAYQSEAELEKEFIQLLCEQGYEYLPIHSEQELIQNSELVTHRHLLEYIKRGDLEGYKHAIVEHFKLYTIYLERHKR